MSSRFSAWARHVAGRTIPPRHREGVKLPGFRDLSSKARSRQRGVGHNNGHNNPHYTRLIFFSGGCLPRIHQWRSRLCGRSASQPKKNLRGRMTGTHWCPVRRRDSRFATRDSGCETRKGGHRQARNGSSLLCLCSVASAEAPPLPRRGPRSILVDPRLPDKGVACTLVASFVRHFSGAVR